MYELSLLARAEIGRNNGRYMDELLDFDSVLELICRRTIRKDIHYDVYVCGSRNKDENIEGIMIRVRTYRFDYSLDTKYIIGIKEEVKRALKNVKVTPRMLSHAVIAPGPNPELKKQFEEFVEWLSAA